VQSTDKVKTWKPIQNCTLVAQKKMKLGTSMEVLCLKSWNANSLLKNSYENDKNSGALGGVDLDFLIFVSIFQQCSNSCKRSEYGF
jgi:hypothetical protein